MSASNTQQPVLNNPKIINAWAMFDWANSAFALVITTAIFPAYFLAVTDPDLTVFGIHTSNSALYAYAISASYLIIAALSPFLSGIADYGGQKKNFLRFFTSMGSLGCLSLFFFQDTAQLAVGTIGFMVGLIGFAGGLVFYNSYLPEIVTEDRYDTVSARGFAFGYTGSVLLLILNLVIIQKPEWFGLPTAGTLPARIAFIMVGLWWLGFSQIPFYFLPNPEPRHASRKMIGKGFAELRKVARSASKQPNLLSFLAAFFCYSAGVQTVIYLAATFAEKELKFATSELIAIILILQVVAIGGAYFFAKVSDKIGNKFSLLIMLAIWTSICIFAYFIQSRLHFYGAAACIGMVMGGIQSLSRSTYSKLLPDGTPDTTSYFSFYDVLEKVAIVCGTFIFGYLDQLTGSMRVSVLILGGFFLIGIALLSRIRVE